jgi:hypothetical protein
MRLGLLDAEGPQTGASMDSLDRAADVGSGPGATLKFAVMCAESRLQRWQAECVRHLVASGIAAPVLTISETAASREGSSDAHTWLFRAWRRAIVMPRAAALSPVERIEELEAIPRILCHLARQGEFSVLADEDLDRIAGYDLDFILRFGSGALAGAVLTLPRWGIWSYRHGAGPGQGGPLSRAADPEDRTAVRTVALIRDGDGSRAGAVLHQGSFREEATEARTLDAALLGSADWCARAACELALGQTARFEREERRPALSDATQVTAPLPAPEAVPRNGSFLVQLAGRSGVLVQKVLRKLFFREVWSIGCVSEPFDKLLERGRPREVRWYPVAPGGDFIADPFCLEGEGEVQVLAEYFDAGRRKGRIVATRFREGAFLPGAITILDLPEHLSYPFLFRWRGDTWMMPEVAESGQIRLYRWDAASSGWSEAAKLLDFPGLDSTLFEHEGRWWLFCTRLGHISEYKLHAWHAPTPLGPWTPHALNPLKCDVHSSRPGGRPFIHNGKLYRPAQNGARTYGGALTLNWVRQLTPTVFEEEVAGALRPDPDGPYPDGLHTLCIAGAMTLIDGKRYEPVFSRWLRRGRTEDAAPQQRQRSAAQVQEIEREGHGSIGRAPDEDLQKKRLETP